MSKIDPKKAQKRPEMVKKDQMLKNAKMANLEKWVILTLAKASMKISVEEEDSERARTSFYAPTLSICVCMIAFQSE